MRRYGSLININSSRIIQKAYGDIQSAIFGDGQIGFSIFISYCFFRLWEAAEISLSHVKSNHKSQS